MDHMVEAADSYQRELLQQIAELKQQVARLEDESIRQQSYTDALFGGIGVGYVIADKDGKPVRFNSYFSDMLGYTPEEIKQTPFKDFTYKDDRGDNVSLYKRLLNGDIDHYRLEKRYVRKDGSLIWVRVNVSRFTDPYFPDQMSMALIEDITAQKQVEEKLQAEKHLSESMIESLPGIFYLFDDANKFLLWNENFKTITGYSDDEIAQMQPFDFFRPDLKPIVEDAIDTAFTEGEVRVELSILNKQGEETHYVFTGKRTHFNGQRAVLGLGIDISDRKSAEEALRRRAEEANSFMERLRALQEVTQALARTETLDDLAQLAVKLGRGKLGLDRIGLWFLDEDDPTTLSGTFGTDEHGNIRDERHSILHLSDEEVFTFLQQQKNLEIVVDRPLYNNKHEVVGTGWHVSAQLFDGDKWIGRLDCDNLLSGQPITPFLLELIQLYSATLGPLIVQKRDREALQKSEGSWRSLVENAPNTILVVDREYRVQFVNRPHEEPITENVVGANVLEFTIPEHRSKMKQALDNVFLTGEPTLYEASGYNKQGELLSFITHVGPVKHDGEITSLILIAQDVTDLRLMERQQFDLEIERQKTQVLSSFITNASHEFRTPLSIINSGVYMLQRLDYEERRKQYYNQITTQVENIASLIENLITMSRLDSGAEFTFSDVDVNTIVRTVVTNVQSLLREAKVTLTLNLDETNPVIYGAGTELYRAIENILVNAIQHSSEDGEIVLETSLEDDNVHVEIIDQGEGIPEHEIPRIFDRFYRVDSARSTRGFGLGLSIARRIVEIHSGEIKVSSTLGEGSRFCVQLPVSLLPTDFRIAN